MELVFNTFLLYKKGAHPGVVEHLMLAILCVLQLRKESTYFLSKLNYKPVRVDAGTAVFSPSVQAHAASSGLSLVLMRGPRPV